MQSLTPAMGWNENARATMLLRILLIANGVLTLFALPAVFTSKSYSRFPLFPPVPSHPASTSEYTAMILEPFLLDALQYRFAVNRN